jgi:hypothetical protein
VLSVTADVKKLSREIDQRFKRQIPYVTSRALNAVAFEGMMATRKALPKFLDKPKKYTTSSVQFEKSHKNRALVSKVGFVSKNPKFGRKANASIPAGEYMQRLIKGGTRKPYFDKIAIPTQMGDRDKYGNMKRGLAKRLLADKKRFFIGVPKNSPMKNWGFALWERVGDSSFGTGNTIRRRIKYVDKTEYSPQFPFRQIVEKAVKAEFGIAFRREFIKAVTRGSGVRYQFSR